MVATTPKMIESLFEPMFPLPVACVTLNKSVAIDGVLWVILECSVMVGHRQRTIFDKNTTVGCAEGCWVVSGDVEFVVHIPHRRSVFPPPV